MITSLVNEIKVHIQDFQLTPKIIDIKIHVLINYG